MYKTKNNIEQNTILVTKEKIYKLLIVYTDVLGIALNSIQLVKGIVLDVVTYGSILVIVLITGELLMKLKSLKY